MTWEKAIELIKFHMKTKAVQHFQKLCEALHMAIEALEKQIPKKVVKVKLRESEWGVPWRCPLCEADIAKVEFMRDDGFEPKEKVSYCWHCGQAIDWSEEK